MGMVLPEAETVLPAPVTIFNASGDWSEMFTVTGPLPVFTPPELPAADVGVACVAPELLGVAVAALVVCTGVGVVPDCTMVVSPQALSRSSAQMLRNSRVKRNKG